MSQNYRPKSTKILIQISAASFVSQKQAQIALFGFNSSLILSELVTVKNVVSFEIASISVYTNNSATKPHDDNSFTLS